MQLWVIDVDGTLVVIDGTIAHATPLETRANETILQIVESIRFD